MVHDFKYVYPSGQLMVAGVQVVPNASLYESAGHCGAVSGVHDFASHLRTFDVG